MLKQLVIFQRFSYHACMFVCVCVCVFIEQNWAQKSGRELKMCVVFLSCCSFQTLFIFFFFFFLDAMRKEEKKNNEAAYSFDSLCARVCE